MTAPHVVLSVFAPKEVAERLTDLLLGHEPTAAAGFTSGEVQGYGAATVFRSVAEQIRGRTRLVEITVVGTEPDVGDLLARLAEELPGRGITYRICALASAGTLV